MDSVSWDPDMQRVRLSGEEMQESTADRNGASVGSGPGNLVTCCHLQVLCGAASNIPEQLVVIMAPSRGHWDPFPACSLLLQL